MSRRRPARACTAIAAVLAFAGAAGCTGPAPSASGAAPGAAAGAGTAAPAASGAAAAGLPDASLLAWMRESFVARGQAGLDRLDQDDTQRRCSMAAARGGLPPDEAESIRRDNQALLRIPTGPLAGSWTRGEAIAQNGVGRQFSDPPDVPSGGNCYACHRLSAQEIAFGTIGPSLHQYGRLRAGVPREILERETYGHIYDAQAYTACSLMPRFGARGILDDAQIRDLVALLLDPDSPVNRP